VSGFALHRDDGGDPVLGRLVARGLHDELKGSAYAIVEGVDGRTHHLRFSDLEMTGDAKPGAIVEARAYEDADGRKRLSLATRSDFTIDAQITAPGATWCGWRRRPADRRRLDPLGGNGAWPGRAPAGAIAPAGARPGQARQHVRSSLWGRRPGAHAILAVLALE
jgi:hypothetical protein